MNQPLRILELSIPHATAQGTLEAAMKLPERVAQAGFNTVYVLPWMKINREMSPSPFAVVNHQALEPSIGSIEEVINWIDCCHSNGLSVVLDMPLNHTSPSHSWTTYQGWYRKDSSGNMHAPLGTDWNDVVQLDHSNEDVSEACLNVLRFWIECGVDGFRLDAASFIPPETVANWISSIRLESQRELHFWCDGHELVNSCGDFSAYFNHDAFRKAKAGEESWNHLLNSYSRNAIFYLTNHDTLHARRSPKVEWGADYERMRNVLVESMRHSMLSWSDWMNPEEYYSFMHR
jgi:glycosidase